MGFQYEWYDPESRVLVCPAKAADADDVCSRLLKIGCARFGACEIPMPLDLGVRFFRFQLPPWLKFSSDIDEDALTFYDVRGNERLEVIRHHESFSTKVLSRYLPLDHYRTGCMPVVKDLARDDERHLVWSDPAWRPGRGESSIARAERWLDENRPDWRNPAAYWDEE